jgi:hypothetical protein
VERDLSPSLGESEKRREKREEKREKKDEYTLPLQYNTVFPVQLPNISYFVRV